MYGAKGKAYAKIEVESAVMSASQHQLVIMLFDGALSALARVCSCRTAISRQRLALSKAINIIENG
jgi:flagellar protein FliS